jgi:hypothetical protein
VLEHFNPENEPGGADGIVKTFTVNGELVVSIPAVQHGAAVFSALRVSRDQQAAKPSAGVSDQFVSPAGVACFM